MGKDIILKHNNKLIAWNSNQIRVGQTVDAPVSYVTATGGTITTDGDFKIHTFTDSSLFIVTVSGDVSALVVGGGGGGGDCSQTGYGPGGGGGEMLEDTLTVSTQEYNIKVAVTTPHMTDGSTSIFSSLTAKGGYTGGEGPAVGGNSGSGYIGGGMASSYSAGGGGGDSGNGKSQSEWRKQQGGDSTLSEITGNYYGGGGGGGNEGSDNIFGWPDYIWVDASTIISTGGYGGLGGIRLEQSPWILDGSTNTGGGGGGGGWHTQNGPQPGNKGGSGIVVIKYKYQ